MSPSQRATILAGIICHRQPLVGSLHQLFPLKNRHSVRRTAKETGRVTENPEEIYALYNCNDYTVQNGQIKMAGSQKLDCYVLRVQTDRRGTSRSETFIANNSILYEFVHIFIIFLRNLTLIWKSTEIKHPSISKDFNF